MDENKIKDTISFLVESGAALLLLTQENNIEKALKKIVGNSELRYRVCNFFDIFDFGEIWFHFNKLTENEKSLINFEVQKTLKRSKK